MSSFLRMKTVFLYVLRSYSPCDSVCSTNTEIPARNTDAQWKSSMPEKTKLSLQQVTSDDRKHCARRANNEYDLTLKFNNIYTFVVRATV